MLKNVNFFLEKDLYVWVGNQGVGFIVSDTSNILLIKY